MDAAFRSALVRIGFSVPTAAYINSDAGQGILFPDLVDLADEDVSTLCSAIRQPGGLINDPNPPAGAAAQMLAPQIRNPGIPVSALAERRLKVLIYLARLYTRRINRTLSLPWLPLRKSGTHKSSWKETQPIAIPLKSARSRIPKQ